MSRLTIGIVGFGRFGKFFSKYLRRKGKLRIFDKKTSLAGLCECDWVMLSVPISEMANVTKKISHFLKPGALVFDVCSVKMWPCDCMKKNLPKNVSIIGTHPLFGPDSAKITLKNHVMAVTPVKTSKFHLQTLTDFFKKLKLRIVKTTPQIHDKAMAKTQALVHFLSRALPPITPEKLSTATYRTLSNIFRDLQHDTMQLFFDMQTKNPFAKKIRQNFLFRADRLEKTIIHHKK